jgi:hypothetical protein
MRIHQMLRPFWAMLKDYGILINYLSRSGLKGLPKKLIQVELMCICRTYTHRNNIENSLKIPILFPCIMNPEKYPNPNIHHRSIGVGASVSTGVGFGFVGYARCCKYT